MSDIDIVTELRQRHANVTGIDTRITTPIVGPTIFSQAADEIERLRNTRDALEAERDELIRIANKMTRERDEARLQTRRILNEIDCRIEHGAESSGHLEAIYSMFKENTND